MKKRTMKKTTKEEGPRIFKINVVVEHGQLREFLDSPADRQLMIDRLNAILQDTSEENKPVREGVIQILTDQLVGDNGHEPLFIRTGLVDGDVEEQILWNSQIIEVTDPKRRGQIVDIEVDIDKFRKTPKTPHTEKPGNPFKFTGGNKGKEVYSRQHKKKKDSIVQKFYKFSIEAEDGVGNLLKLDPCIICDR